MDNFMDEFVQSYDLGLHQLPELPAARRSRRQAGLSIGGLERQPLASAASAVPAAPAAAAARGARPEESQPTGCSPEASPHRRFLTSRTSGYCTFRRLLPAKIVSFRFPEKFNSRNVNEWLG
ncbi:unnamed protein product [Nesidiocoris tenuis]|uniref:Uncharacterized protein n=1 Tax=Nesidiocoris tenuis TaxID=355587 RepID=A0A6H5GNA8_9HEMI|nr:unnamed protein product [Nesidiocoris tenuis]